MRSRISAMNPGIGARLGAVGSEGDRSPIDPADVLHEVDYARILPVAMATSR
jgi:hypothetical protein